MNGKISERTKAGKLHQFMFLNTGRIMGIVVVSSILGALMVGYFLERDLTQGYASAVSRISEARHILTTSLAYSALLQLVISVPAIILGTIFYSNKVVGPIFKFTRIFREISGGRLNEVSSIRKNDELKATITNINHATVGIIGHIDYVSTKSANLQKLLEEYELADERGRVWAFEKLQLESALLLNLTRKMKVVRPISDRG